MQLKGLLLAFATLTAATAVAQDPFVGTWVYNAKTSPKPTITYGIKDLGGDRFALTGSTGETTEIKADGVAIKSPAGATVSFKRLDDHTWQMNRFESQTMVRTYTVSADDKTLTLLDRFTGTDGSHSRLTTTYARTGPGKSIFGEWKSVSMVEESPGDETLTIEPLGSAGITMISNDNKNRTDLTLDGKQYADKDSKSTKAATSSSKRLDTHHIRVEDQIDGKLDDTQDLTVSDDGRTLTMVTTVSKTSVQFTSVFDKK